MEREKLLTGLKTTHNFSYPSSAAAVVSGVHLSARAVFRLDRKPPATRQMPIASVVSQNRTSDSAMDNEIEN